MLIGQAVPDRPRASPEAHLSARESLAARTYFAAIA